MSWLSKLTKPVVTGLVVTGLVVELVAEIYIFVRKRKSKLENEEEAEINEFFFVKQDLDKNTPLTRQMTFSNDRYDDYLDVLRNLIQSAQRTLHVMMYIFSDTKLAQEVIAAHRRGVQVFFVFDASMEHGARNSQVHELHMAGVPVRKYLSTAQVTMHHKICLIDVPYDQHKDKLLPKQNSLQQRSKVPVKVPNKTGIVVGGSLNWTGSALHQNYEAFHVSSNEDYCLKASRDFHAVWNDSIPIV